MTTSPDFSKLKDYKYRFTDIKFPMVLFLLVASFSVQFTGFVFAKYNRKYS